MKTYRSVTVGSVFLTVVLCFTATAQDGRIVSKQYDDGGVYEGTLKNGLQDGIGTYRLPNGYEYTGAWVSGEILGQGEAHFPNGAVYQGHFANHTVSAKSLLVMVAPIRAIGPRG
jgi:hypothetical protein